jgi:hypothetical protein
MANHLITKILPPSPSQAMSSAQSRNSQDGFDAEAFSKMIERMSSQMPRQEDAGGEGNRLRDFDSIGNRLPAGHSSDESLFKKLLQDSLTHQQGQGNGGGSEQEAGADGFDLGMLAQMFGGHDNAGGAEQEAGADGFNMGMLAQMFGGQDHAHGAEEEAGVPGWSRNGFEGTSQGNQAGAGDMRDMATLIQLLSGGDRGARERGTWAQQLGHGYQPSTACHAGAASLWTVSLALFGLFMKLEYIH